MSLLEGLIEGNQEALKQAEGNLESARTRRDPEGIDYYSHDIHICKEFGNILSRTKRLRSEGRVAPSTEDLKAAAEWLHPTEGILICGPIRSAVQEKFTRVADWLRRLEKESE